MKILWDLSIQTDKVIKARRPDIVVVDKVKKTVTIIGFAVPADRNICEKEEEKIMKYQDLRIELSRLWKKKAKVVPVAVASIGSVPKDLQKRLSELDLEDVDCKMLQKAALLGTARILRRALTL